MFNYDILELIFNHLTKINHIFNFRLINKNANEIFKNYFINIKQELSPVSSVINFKECNLCYQKCSSIKKLIYKYDIFPHKYLIHCNNKLCYLSIIKKYLLDLKKNNVYPFCFIENKYIKIFKENNNIMNKFILGTLKKYNNKWYIKCEDNIQKTQKYIKIIDTSFIKNYNLFNWV